MVERFGVTGERILRGDERREIDLLRDVDGDVERTLSVPFGPVGVGAADVEFAVPDRREIDPGRTGETDAG